MGTFRINKSDSNPCQVVYGDLEYEIMKEFPEFEIKGYLGRPDIGNLIQGVLKLC